MHCQRLHLSDIEIDLPNLDRSDPLLNCGFVSLLEVAFWLAFAGVWILGMGVAVVEWLEEVKN